MESPRPSVLLPSVDPALDMSDSDLFWQDHWKKFAGGLIAVVLLILAVGAWTFWQSQQRSAAETLYSVSAGPEGWRAVVEKFPGTVAAGNAQLRLAEAFRTEGKTDEAASTLETFVAAQPEHPLAPVGWLSLGEIRQMQKNETAALEAYRTASGRYAASYAAPMALLAEARLLIAGGSRGEATAVLESIGTAYPQTPAAMVAAGELSLLGVPAGVPPPAPGSN